MEDIKKIGKNIKETIKDEFRSMRPSKKAG
jgi:hypothetical protein